MQEQDYKFKTIPYECQQIGWSKNIKKKYYALLMDLGTGKTKVTLDTAGYMFLNGWINALMVFGNNGSYMNWVEAIDEHLPDIVPRAVGVWSSKNTKKQIDAMYAAIKAPKSILRIFLMNIEALAFPRGFAAAMEFVKSNTTLAVVDESTTIKNPDAARTKAAFKIRDMARARRILTGSPVDNRPLDAWAQFEFLEKGCLGFKSYYAFRAQYAELQEITIQRKGNLQSFKHVTGYKNLDKLRATINELAYIVKKEDCLDLPERLPPMYYNVELTKEQAVLYESLKKRSIVELEKDGSIVSVKQAITKLLRLHQLVCGHLKDDDGVFHEIETNKIKVLGEILDETRGIVIIWTHYTYDILNIKKFLEKEYGPKSVLTYYGDTSQEERAYVKEIFKRGRENNETRFLVANDKTGGYGNNWTAATTSIYYSYDYDYNIHHQTQDRIYRIGQTERTTNVYLVTKGTVEEKMIEVLRTRKNIADMLIQSNWKDLF